MMENRKFRVFASRDPFSIGERVGIRMGYLYESGRYSYVQPMTEYMVGERERGQISPEALSLGYDEAQALADALWSAGIRPTNGEGSTGQLAATQAHLSDFRRIVMHQLKIPEASK